MKTRRLDLQEIRVKHKLTQQKIAEVTDYPQSFISQIERGKVSVPLAFIEKLRSEFNIEDVDDYVTYIEVNIASQHLWYYVDGACVLDFDVVTGMDTASRRTPTGVFQVLWKDTEHTMKGSYGTSFCHFWMPITWEGVGIHDAYWRSSYGGDIWRGSGSHGCINTPYEKMKQLYSMAPEGTPVIVYQM